jgi:hypothetical protein
MALELLLGRKKTPLQFTTAGNNLVLLELDVALSEEHQFNNEVTSFPIEDGSNITDHIKLNPEQITIEGFVTNSPIKNIIQMRNDPVTTNGGFDRVSTAYDAMLAIAGRRGQPPILVDIFSTLRIFTDMALTRLTIPRDGTIGESLKFTADFVRVHKATLGEATIYYTSDRKYGSGGVKDGAQPTTNTGKQLASDVADDKKTTLRAATDAFLNWASKGK